MGVTVKYLEPAAAQGYSQHYRSAFTFDGHDAGLLRKRHDKSRRAAIGGHAVYSDRQNSFINAFLDKEWASSEDALALAKKRAPMTWCVRKSGSVYDRQHDREGTCRLKRAKAKTLSAGTSTSFAVTDTP